MACDGLGYTREELLTLHTWDLLVDWDEAKAGALWKQALSVEDHATNFDAVKTVEVWRQRGPGDRNVHITMDVTFRRKDGTTFPAEARVGMVEVGGQVLFAALARDMTEHSRAAEVLRESEERYRTLFEDTRDAIFISSADGKVIDCNRAALELFGFTEDQAIGSDISERYVDSTDRERFREEISRAGSVRDFEVKLRKRDGTEMYCLLTATRRRAEDGSNLGAQGTVRDITEQKQAEESQRDLAVLEERNRMAREIHDTLAQGFTGIVLQLEAAEQASEGSPDQVPGHLTQAKGLARESLQEARRSVWNLLPQALEEHSLDGALQEEVHRFAREGVEQASFSSSGAKYGLASEMQTALLRICQELLTNIKRHARATEVHVELSFLPEEVCLSVHDNGTGFDFQTTRNADGQSGFGLTGMEQRTRLLGGTLTITSKKGNGTRVEARIPAG